MSSGYQLYKFRVDLSDIDHNHYESLKYSVVLHPSETIERMVVRSVLYSVFRFCSVEFSSGVCLGDEPDLFVKDFHGAGKISLQVGFPTKSKRQKLLKNFDKVFLFLFGKSVNKYKQLGVRSFKGREEVIYILENKFIEQIVRDVKRNNRWVMVIQDGNVQIISDSMEFSFHIGLNI